MTYSEPYPNSPQQPAPSAGPLSPPRFVNIAYWLFLLTALAKLVTIVIAFAQLGNVTSMATTRLNGTSTGLSQGQEETLIRGSLIGSLVFAILFLVAFVIFDMLMRRGANWARWVLLILTILSLSGVTGAYGVGALAVAASVIACILMFVGESGPYFKAVKQQKLAARGQAPAV